MQFEDENLVQLCGRYQQLLARVKETKEQNAAYMRERKLWMKLKAEMKQMLVEDDTEVASVKMGEIELASRKELADLIRWIRDTVACSKRFIPIKKMANEYFSGTQLMEVVRKRHPAAVFSMYQCEQLGQWFLDHGHMVHYNDMLGMRKKYDPAGFYCWKTSTPAKTRYTRFVANDMMYEQWCKYEVCKLAFEVQLELSLIHI